MRLEDEIKQKKFANEYQKLTINILFTSSWLNGSHQKRLRPYGISPQQFNILRILRGQYPKPTSIGLLIDRMIDKMSNASRLVEKLRQKEFVERTECPTDRRRVDVVITQKGLDLLEEISDRFKDFVDLMEGITEEEAALANRVLDKMRDLDLEETPES